jgi:hypothetical protein
VRGLVDDRYYARISPIAGTSSPDRAGAGGRLHRQDFTSAPRGAQRQSLISVVVRFSAIAT